MVCAYLNGEADVHLEQLVCTWLLRHDILLWTTSSSSTSLLIMISVVAQRWHSVYSAVTSKACPVKLCTYFSQHLQTRWLSLNALQSNVQSINYDSQSIFTCSSHENEHFQIRAICISWTSKPLTKHTPMQVTQHIWSHACRSKTSYSHQNQSSPPLNTAHFSWQLFLHAHFLHVPPGQKDWAQAQSNTMQRDTDTIPFNRELLIAQETFLMGLLVQPRHAPEGA